MFYFGPLHFDKRASAVPIFITVNTHPNGNCFVFYKNSLYGKSGKSPSEIMIKDKFLYDFWIKRLHLYKEYYYNRNQNNNNGAL